MASIGRDAGGWRRILFVAPDGKRKTIRLGKVSQRSAEGIKYRVEQLLESLLLNRSMEADLAQWVVDLESVLADKLAAVGLIVPRHGETIDGMLNDFKTANSHAKPATLVVWGQVGRCLREHFGADRQIRTIGQAEAEGFRQWLIGKKLAATTITKRVQFARQFFAYAVRCEWIERNPFADVSHKDDDPRARQRYITVEETKLLIDAAPNWVWRTIIALARFGGLRNPSETLSLRLADLDWEHGMGLWPSYRPRRKGTDKGIA